MPWTIPIWGTYVIVLLAGAVAGTGFWFVLAMRWSNKKGKN